MERGPQIRRTVLLAGIVGVPVVFTRFNADPLNVPKLGLLLIVVAVAGAIRIGELLQGVGSDTFRRMAIPVAAFLAPLFLAWLFSPYRGFTLIGNYGRLQGLIPYVAVVAFGVLVADSFAGRLRDIAWGLAWAGGIVGAYAVIQVIGIDPFEWALFGSPTDAVSTIGNPNFTGGFLAICLPVGLALFLTEQERRARARNLLLATIAGWVVARSQGGYAAGLTALAIVGAALVTDRWRRARAAVLSGAALVALAIVGGVLFTVMSETGPKPSSFVLRGRWWVAAAGMALDNPLVGRGPDSFAIEGVSYRTQEDAIEQSFDFTDDPHSVPLSIAAGAGVLGLLGWGAALAWGVKRGTDRAPDDLLGNAFLASLIAYAIQSLVSVDVLPLRIGLWTSLGALGVAVGAGRETQAGRKGKGKTTKKQRTPREPLRRAPLVFVALLVGVAIIVWAATYVYVDARALNAFDSLARGDTQEGDEAIDEVLAFRNDVYYAGVRAFALAAEAVEKKQPSLYETADDAFSYTDSVPYVFALVERSHVRWEWGHAVDDPSITALALPPLERAFALDDKNPQIRAELAAVLLELDRDEDALAVLEPAASNVPPTSSPLFWGSLALAAARTGDLEVAAEAARTALTLDPNEPRALGAQRLLENG